MTGYLTLSEAAEYVATKTGVQVTASEILRAGVHGELLIAAPFSSTMRNLKAHCDDEVLGLLTIPPRHLMEIETDGQTRIIGAFSLDGKAGYSPQMVRTIDHLRVLVSELDRSMDMWVHLSTAASSGTTEIAQPPKVGAVITVHKLRENSLDAPIRKAIKAANSRSTSAVFIHLRELALSGEIPFTGAFEGAAICYTNDDGKTAKLSKGALGKRIKKL